MSKVRSFNEWDMEERVNILEQHTYGPLARRTDIAPDFSTEEAYAKDDVVYYNGILYKFTTDHAAGAWNSAEVEETTIAENLGGTDGGAVSVEKVLAGALDTRLNNLIQKYGDGAKILCDYLEFPMYINRSESGEQYNYGSKYFAINGYYSRFDDETQKTYGKATVMTVNGNTGTSKHYKIVTDDSTTANGVNIRFTNVEIEIQKQDDDSYNCIISYDKAYLVPKTRMQIEITTVTYDMNSKSGSYYEVTAVSSSPSNYRYAKMIDITPALEYDAEYRTFSGKFKNLVTVSADLQTVTWVANNTAFLSYPKQAKEANGWFLNVMEGLSRYSGGGDGYILCSGSTTYERLPDGSAISGQYNGCLLVRYVDISDGIVLVPDEV